MNGIVFFPAAACPLKHSRRLPRSLAADPPSHDTARPPRSLLQKIAVCIYLSYSSLTLASSPPLTRDKVLWRLLDAPLLPAGGDRARQLSNPLSVLFIGCSLCLNCIKSKWLTCYLRGSVLYVMVWEVLFWLFVIVCCSCSVELLVWF